MNELEELKEALAKISTAWNEYFAYKYDIKLEDYQYMQKTNLQSTKHSGFHR